MNKLNISTNGIKYIQSSTPHNKKLFVSKSSNLLFSKTSCSPSFNLKSYLGNIYTASLRAYCNKSSENVKKHVPKTKEELNKELKVLREKFYEDEIIRNSIVKLELLTLEEQEIHWKHLEAIDKKYFTYEDPSTGNRVMTRLRHFLRGSCCGNACRHVRNYTFIL